MKDNFGIINTTILQYKQALIHVSGYTMYNRFTLSLVGASNFEFLFKTLTFSWDESFGIISDFELVKFNCSL